MALNKTLAIETKSQMKKAFTIIAIFLFSKT